MVTPLLALKRQDSGGQTWLPSGLEALLLPGLLVSQDGTAKNGSRSDLWKLLTDEQQGGAWRVEGQLVPTWDTSPLCLSSLSELFLGSQRHSPEDLTETPGATYQADFIPDPEVPFVSKMLGSGRRAGQGRVDVLLPSCQQT